MWAQPRGLAKKVELSEYQPDNWDTGYDSETTYPHSAYEKNVGIPEVYATLYPEE